MDEGGEVEVCEGEGRKKERTRREEMEEKSSSSFLLGVEREKVFSSLQFSFFSFFVALLLPLRLVFLLSPLLPRPSSLCFFFLFLEPSLSPSESFSFSRTKEEEDQEGERKKKTELEG